MGQRGTYRDRTALEHETASDAAVRQDNAPEKKYHRVNQRYAQERGTAGAFASSERPQFHHEPACGNGRILLLRHKTRSQFRLRGATIQRAARTLAINSSG